MQKILQAALQRMQVLSPFLFSVALILHIEDMYEYLTRVGVRHSYDTDTCNYIQQFSFTQIMNMINVYMLLGVFSVGIFTCVYASKILFSHVFMCIFYGLFVVICIITVCIV